MTLAQRFWQDFTHAAKMSAGQRSIQAFNDPPGQSEGDGVGLGLGDGVGAGLGPPEIVEPMGPNLMSEKITCELACWDSTSFGTPDVVGQEPRSAPGSLESTGYVESSQSMFA